MASLSSTKVIPLLGQFLDYGTMNNEKNIADIMKLFKGFGVCLRKKIINLVPAY